MSANHDLVLYYRPTCPFCIRVTDFMRTAASKFPCANISIDSEAARTLVSVGGKQQVPCLFIDGKPLYESSDIIAWLDANF